MPKILKYLILHTLRAQYFKKLVFHLESQCPEDSYALIGFLSSRCLVCNQKTKCGFRKLTIVSNSNHNILNYDGLYYYNNFNFLRIDIHSPINFLGNISSWPWIISWSSISCYKLINADV